MPKTLFVVDDSATMRTAFELTFVGEDITVVTHDGSDGVVDRAREVRPDCAIVDVNLNGAAGYAVVRAMRQDAALASVPVLLLYSDFSPLDEAQARACNSQGQIAKPYETGALIDRVKLLLASPAPVAQPVAPAPAPRPAVSETVTATRQAPSAAGAPARPAPTAGRPFAATTVANAVPPPVAPRPAVSPAAPLAQRPIAPARPQPAPAPALSLDPMETDIQLEPGMLAELGPLPGPAPVTSAPAASPFPASSSAMRAYTAPLGARITPEPPVAAPRPALPAAREPVAPAAPVAREPAPAAPIAREPAPAAPVAREPAPAAPVAPIAPAPIAPAPIAPAPAVVAPAPAPVVAAAAVVSDEITRKASALGLTPAQVEAVAALARDIVERVVWEVVPQLAETMIREEIRRIMSDDTKS